MQGLKSIKIVKKIFDCLGLICYRRSNMAYFWFSKSFFYVKNQQIFLISFLLKNIKLREQLLLLTYFDNIDVNVLYFLKMGPNFPRAILVHESPVAKNIVQWRAPHWTSFLATGHLLTRAGSRTFLWHFQQIFAFFIRH